MTLINARKLRDEIRAAGLWSGVYMHGKENGPNRFKASICASKGQVDFASREEWLEYKVGMDARKPRGRTYYRITVDTILPPSLRAGPMTAGLPDYEHIVASQHPVSDWLEIPEWVMFNERLRHAKPVNKLGLIYGYQKKEVEGAKHDYSAELAALKALTPETTMPYFDKMVRDREEKFATIVKRVDEVVAELPMYELYVMHGMDAVLSGKAILDLEG